MQPTRLQRVSTSEGTMNKTQNKSVIWSAEKANQIQSTLEILSMNTDEHRVVIYADRDTHQNDERTWPTNSVAYPHDWDLIRSNDTHVAQHHAQICFQSPWMKLLVFWTNFERQAPIPNSIEATTEIRKKAPQRIITSRSFR